MSGFGSTIKPDKTHLDFPTLTELQAFITYVGAKLAWGWSGTVFSDDANDGTYTLTYNHVDADKNNPANLVKGAGGGGAGSVNWGNIGGTLSNQSDLNTALNNRLKLVVDENLHYILPDVDATRSFRIGQLGDRFNNITRYASLRITDFVGNSDFYMENDFVRISNVIGGFKSLRVDDTGIIVRDALGRGLQGFADYSSGYQNLDYIQKIYADQRLGGQAIAAGSLTPGAAQNGYVLAWNNTNQEYELVPQSSGGGVTNSGAANELVKSDGTNIIGAKLFSSNNGNLSLGDNTVSGDKIFEFFGQGFQDNLVFKSTGVGNGRVYFETGLIAVRKSPSTLDSIFIDAFNWNIYPFKQDGTTQDLELRGNIATALNNDGGGVLIQGGVGNGTGSRGAVKIRQEFKTITATSYSLVESDWGKVLEFTNSNPISVTLPNGLPQGFQCALVRDTASGTVSITATTTLKSSGTDITSVHEWAYVTHKAANEWRASGLN
ncbi:MAG: hypothetical protein ACFB2Y_09780 [Fulvivirga sp.]